MLLCRRAVLQLRSSPLQSCPLLADSFLVQCYGRTCWSDKVNLRCGINSWERLSFAPFYLSHANCCFHVSQKSRSFVASAICFPNLPESVNSLWWNHDLQGGSDPTLERKLHLGKHNMQKCLWCRKMELNRYFPMVRGSSFISPWICWKLFQQTFLGYVLEKIQVDPCTLVNGDTPQLKTSARMANEFLSKHSRDTEQICCSQRS